MFESQKKIENRLSTTNFETRQSKKQNLTFQNGCLQSVFMYCMQSFSVPYSLFYVSRATDARKSIFRFALYAESVKRNSEISAYRADVRLNILSFVLQSMQTKYIFCEFLFSVSARSGSISDLTDEAGKLAPHGVHCG